MKSVFYLFLLIVFVHCKNSQEKVTRKPNIVFILADDQGWGDLSFNGNKNVQTPNIDSIAHNGVHFKNFYVSPVCSPTRAEILTGRYATRLGVYSTSAGGERINLGETTIAEIFKNAGYTTAAYGKWHNGTQPPYHPNSRGFDDYYGFASGHWGHYFSPMLEHNGEIVKGDGFLVDDFVNKGMDFITENAHQPFFLYLPLNTPHSPMQVPEEFWNKMKNKDLIDKYHGAEQEDIIFTKAALAMTENIDWNVGRLKQRLKDLNLEENTIIVYMTDNGPNGWRWNGGMRGKKGSTDEGGVKSPLFIQWKNKLPKGKSIAQIASSIDLLPTLSGLAGIDAKTNHGLDGRNLHPLIIDSTSIKWTDRTIVNHWRGKTSVRTQKYRLDDDGRLYDMDTDLGQTINIADKFPKLLDSLKKIKYKWLKEITFPKNNPRPFTVGFSNQPTHLPARDAVSEGEILRSNRYPNDSYFYNWTNLFDKINWTVEVLNDGVYEAEIYYSCAKENIGSSFQLSFGNNTLKTLITEAHDPVLYGMEKDKSPRIESYVKDFKPLKIGRIQLEKGIGKLSLSATEIPSKEVMDFRLLILTRVE
ncbi:arylsulfatase A-like enzyme [Saonia flava]|uniref:Arylsulfatase A-like enzyme n=1 Tax=Saonia flava TaxID=523696 RepID=A0A846QMT5_9FLAO|nr:arylsulfatase [Saonia flava]NJB70326.1 arylsulfatase A-like enzyme [Saonia flava]